MNRPVLHLLPVPDTGPQLSPFCLKLKTAFDLAGVPYSINDVIVPQKGPKGKLPYATIDGKQYGDSHLIMKHLATEFSRFSDPHLTPELRAQGLFIERTLEEHLYFIILYSRWLDPAAWDEIRERTKAFIPTPFQVVMPWVIRIGMWRLLRTQGIGRHGIQDVYYFGKKTLDALELVLKKDQFLLGNEPSMFDATTYSFLVSLTDTGFGTELEKYASSSTVFEKYKRGVEREMNARSSS